MRKSNLGAPCVDKSHDSMIGYVKTSHTITPSAAEYESE